MPVVKLSSTSPPRRVLAENGGRERSASWATSPGCVAEGLPAGLGSGFDFEVDGVDGAAGRDGEAATGASTWPFDVIVTGAGSRRSRTLWKSSTPRTSAAAIERAAKIRARQRCRTYDSIAGREASSC